MRGKYSPTVSRAYMTDKHWWDKYSGDTDAMWVPYDPEGYDSYGYNQNGVDRAGNDEFDYVQNDAPHGSDWDYNHRYDDTANAWGFDGVKPVLNS
jgi:hypothetical protein